MNQTQNMFLIRAKNILTLSGSPVEESLLQNSDVCFKMVFVIVVCEAQEKIAFIKTTNSNGSKLHRKLSIEVLWRKSNENFLKMRNYVKMVTGLAN